MITELKWDCRCAAEPVTNPGVEPYIHSQRSNQLVAVCSVGSQPLPLPSLSGEVTPQPPQTTSCSPACLDDTCARSYPVVQSQLGDKSSRTIKGEIQDAHLLARRAAPQTEEHQGIGRSIAVTYTRTYTIPHKPFGTCTGP